MRKNTSGSKMVERAEEDEMELSAEMENRANVPAKKPSGGLQRGKRKMERAVEAQSKSPSSGGLQRGKRKMGHAVEEEMERATDMGKRAKVQLKNPSGGLQRGKTDVGKGAKVQLENPSGGLQREKTGVGKGAKVQLKNPSGGIQRGKTNVGKGAKVQMENPSGGLQREKTGVGKEAKVQLENPSGGIQRGKTGVGKGAKVQLKNPSGGLQRGKRKMEHAMEDKMERSAPAAIEGTSGTKIEASIRRKKEVNKWNLDPKVNVIRVEPALPTSVGRKLVRYAKKKGFEVLDPKFWSKKKAVQDTKAESEAPPPDCDPAEISSGASEE